MSFACHGSDLFWQRLGKNLWHDAELTVTKFAAKTVANEKRCLKVTNGPSFTEQTSIFNSKIFLAICYSKFCATNHPVVDLKDLS